MFEKLKYDHFLMIDLHGCSVADAKRIIAEKLAQIEANRLTQLYIITGWGKHVNPNGARGVLKKILPKLLKPYQTEILDIQEEKGAYQVILKNHERQKKLYVELFSSMGGYHTTEEKIQHLKTCEIQAQKGDFDSMLFLAFAHLYYGIEGYSDRAKGLNLLESAKAKGSLEASVALGELYSDGVVVARDDKKALGYFKEAAEDGDDLGQYKLAICYLTGKCVKKNDREGFLWMKKAADAGNGFAEHALGESYFTGDFTERDFILSFKYMEKAALQHVTAAQVQLGRCYGTGAYGVAQDVRRAFHYYWLAAQKNDLFAIYQVATYLGDGRLDGIPDLEASFRWMLKGAELGDADCQTEVAIKYFSEGNMAQSMYWCQKGLIGGSKGADWLMSYAYRLGKGVEKDLKKSLDHLTKAAQKGFTRAQAELKKWHQENTVAYTFEGKTKISDTTCITWLNQKTVLTFFGWCHQDYQVDAVAEIASQTMEEKATHLRTQLGYGKFFTAGHQKHFVLEGINLPEEGVSLGQMIRRELR